VGFKALSNPGLKLKKWLEQSADLDFQGLQVVSYHRGKKFLQTGAGKTFAFYDVASLTKIFFTTLWFMDFFEQDSKILDRKVQSLLPWYQHSGPKVGKLLNHSAGNQWWEPFYKSISGGMDPDQSYQQMEKLCQKAPLAKSSASVYSDIDFYLLGSIMKKLDGRPLAMIWQDHKEKYLSKTHFHFNYQNKPQQSRKHYAPTEKCPWRKRVIQGEVHDENCWALGGVAPHAGLFGRIEDLAFYGLLLRQILAGKNRSISAKTLKRFTSRSLPQGKGDWGYGFMVPSLKGSSAGELFDKTSFGHTGFTGTSFWYDSTRDLFVGVLSNRVHPKRTNKGFIRLRPKVHDWIVGEIEGSND
jgi:CubicO group peptidase (beta-lactamase class C family)